MLWCVCIIWQTCVICDAYYWFLWLPCSGKCLQYLWELCGFSLIHVSMRFLRLWLHASWHTSRLSSFSSICVSMCLLRLQHLEKSFLTNITFVRLCSGMCKHVSIKIALQRKCFVTNITFVWSFARMHKHVCLKTVTSSKSLATHITLVWLLACVCEQVSLKIATLSKSLLTHVTFVWFIGCV